MHRATGLQTADSRRRPVAAPGAPGLPPQGPQINTNPVYDAARRLSNLCVRVINRKQFIGYEVAGGKTVLYFKRYAFGSDNTRVDPFAGIAPPVDAIASGKIVEG